MLKFKNQYPILKMAKSTGIDQGIMFCEIIEGLGQFETPNYQLLRKVIKSENYDASIITKKLSNSVPHFPVKKLIIRK